MATMATRLAGALTFFCLAHVVHSLHAQGCPFHSAVDVQRTCSSTAGMHARHASMSARHEERLWLGTQEDALGTAACVPSSASPTMLGLDVQSRAGAGTTLLRRHGRLGATTAVILLLLVLLATHNTRQAVRAPPFLEGQRIMKS